MLSDVERMTLLGFLAAYRGYTRDAYALDLRQFTAWCWQHDHAWAPDGALWYMAGGGCEPGPDCEEELWRATFTASDEGDGFATEYTSRDLLLEDSDDLVVGGFTGVRAVAADPFDPSRAAVVDATGLHLVDIGNETQTVVTSPTLELATFTSDGQQLVVTTRRWRLGAPRA